MEIILGTKTSMNASENENENVNSTRTNEVLYYNAMVLQCFCILK